VEELGMDALLPGPALVHEGHVGPPQGAHLEDVLGRDPRLRQPALAEELAQEPRVGAVRLGPLLATTQGRRVGRLGEVGLHTRPAELLDDEAPARAALERDGHVGPPGEALGEPAPQGRPRRRADLARAHLAAVGIEIVERDLSTVHVKTAYDRHRDPLELLSCAPACASAEGVPSHVIFRGGA
jgi:hypothetical protein